MREPIRGIAIYPNKTIAEVSLSGLKDYQTIVGGLIEPIGLRFGTMYVNEEFTYKFTSEDVNWIASDVAGVGGAQGFLFNPILGPVVVVGHLDDEGYDLSVNESGLRAIKKVAGEAGGEWHELEAS